MFLFAQADWQQINAAAEHDTDENHSFSGMCAFSMGIMGEEAEGARQFFFMSMMVATGCNCSGVHFKIQYDWSNLRKEFIVLGPCLCLIAEAHCVCSSFSVAISGT